MGVYAHMYVKMCIFLKLKPPQSCCRWLLPGEIVLSALDLLAFVCLCPVSVLLR